MRLVVVVVVVISHRLNETVKKKKNTKIKKDKNEVMIRVYMMRYAHTYICLYICM